MIRDNYTGIGFKNHNVIVQKLYKPKEIKISISAKDGSFNSNLESITLSLSTNNLSFGAHKFFIRYKDSNGVWSNARSQLITISNPDTSKIAYIFGGEYFIDTDPGRGLGFSLTAKDGSFNDTTEILTGTYVENYNLTHGTHSINVRGKNSKGNWGVATSTTLQIIDVTKPTITVSSSLTSPTSTSPI